MEYKDGFKSPMAGDDIHEISRPYSSTYNNECARLSPQA